METGFIHLNTNWNAEPNAPDEEVYEGPGYISLYFTANPWAYDGFDENQRLELRFHGCSKWRLGETNDEGWYSGLCRFSDKAPQWGEFYEVTGNTLSDNSPNDWQHIEDSTGKKHFIFYLRNNTFECEADSFELIV